MQVSGSRYIEANRPLFRQLQQELSQKYDYASVLAADGIQRSYRISASGISVSASDNFGRRGFNVRVFRGGRCAEYASVEISEELIPQIVEKIDRDLQALGAAFDGYETAAPAEEELSFVKSTEYEIHPDDLGDDKILDRLSELREYTRGLDEKILDCMASVNYQIYNKLFLSDKKDLEQNAMMTCGALVVIAARGEELKDSYKGFSGMCGMELLDKMREAAPTRVKTVIDLLDSEPLPPGTYECVCSPETTGMIVHEAFGHGVEMDMFVKDRALARNCMGEMVASELVNMRDGAASAYEVASYFFDDEGNVAGDTLIIDHGRLVAGMSDALSAARLGTAPTGNGRRESVERKAYTRMTNTFFEGGHDKVEDMIASVRDGLLLDEPASGMEDPKNWGIQCMVSFGREIKDGRLTGRIFSPIVLTGYVPDLLKSITMMSENVELGGAGACGKGHKEWVKVSDGGPWIKAQIRLG